MDDYLNEAEQWEWLKAQIREYGLWILGGVLLGAAGIGAWFAWQSHSDNVAQQASAQYEELRRSFSSPDRTQAMVKLGDLERSFPGSPYVDQARLMAARTYVESGDLARAATELQRVADTTRDRELAIVARLRLARVQIAQKQPDAAIASLATLDAKNSGAFDARVHEVRGDAYYAKGDKKTALQEYNAARLSALASRSGAQPLLDLKISDLVAQVAPAGGAAIPGQSAAPANKAAAPPLAK